jgi:hypothetical protein
MHEEVIWKYNSAPHIKWKKIDYNMVIMKKQN